MHARLRDAFLGAWGRAVSAHPVPTLVIGLALAGGGLALAAAKLEVRTERSELVDPGLPWNRRYSEYRARFDRWDDVIVCIDGSPGDARVDDLARRLADDLRSSPHVAAADGGFDGRDVGPRLFAAAPPAEFLQAMEDLERAKRMTAARNASEALATALFGAAARREQAGTLESLEAFFAPYVAGLSGGTPDFSFLRPDPSRWVPLVSPRGTGRLRFVRVQFAGAATSFSGLTANVAWLREHIAGFVAAAPDVPIEWGVTGIPAIEADETAQSIKDSTIASFVAFALITGFMLFVFRGVVVPLLAAGALLVGLAWSFGWVILSVGHLQLLSVIFISILLGMGIDYPLHLVARLELVKDEHDTLPDAMARVFRFTGPGMLTGTLTTATGFGATMLTRFTGMKEMGIIAGGGILLCLVATLSCFPAALALTRRWERIIRPRPGGETAHFARGSFDTVDFHPKLTLAVTLALVALLAVPMVRVRYDPNVLHLQPPGVESVRWEKRIVEDDSSGVWSAVVETTPDGAPGLADRLRALPQVSSVGALGMLLPADRVRRAKRIAELRSLPVAPPAVAPGLEPMRAQLNTVRNGLLDRARTTDGETAERLERMAEALAGALAASARLDGEESERRLAALGAAFEESRAALEAWVEEALRPVAPAPSDLPPMLRDQWHRDGVWLLEVYPAADPKGRSVLDPDRLRAFVESVESVAPGATGHAVQIHESSKLIKREYIKAAAYAVAAILVILLLDFRSLADTLCAMLPVTIGFVGTFGLLGLFGVPLNFANVIVLPLIFGIGVDAGVHAVYRWRMEPYGRPAGLSGGTGRSIMLAKLTTIFGFGSMLVAEHRGIRSLAFVMTVGLTVTLLACYTVLPAVLRLRTTHWRDERRSEAAGEARAG